VLTNKYLGRTIQGVTHDSCEDATATMELALLAARNGTHGRWWLLRVSRISRRAMPAVVRWTFSDYSILRASSDTCYGSLGIPLLGSVTVLPSLLYGRQARYQASPSACCMCSARSTRPPPSLDRRSRFVLPSRAPSRPLTAGPPPRSGLLIFLRASHFHCVALPLNLNALYGLVLFPFAQVFAALQQELAQAESPSPLVAALPEAVPVTSALLEALFAELPSNCVVFIVTPDGTDEATEGPGASPCSSRGGRGGRGGVFQRHRSTGREREKVTLMARVRCIFTPKRKR